jgi:hypothetical protein
METQIKSFGIEQIVDYLWAIGIDDEHHQSEWMFYQLGYRPYTLSDESDLFIYDFHEECVEHSVFKNITEDGEECLEWLMNRHRPVSSGYEKPY